MVPFYLEPYFSHAIPNEHSILLEDTVERITPPHGREGGLLTPCSNGKNYDWRWIWLWR